MLKAEIKKKGYVSKHLREEFFPGQSYRDIREWLGKNGLSRHMPIEYDSVLVGIATPAGVLMLIRKADAGQLGMVGRIKETIESDMECAIRSLREEIGIIVRETSIHFVQSNQVKHEYDNKDVVIFNESRYLVDMDKIPTVKIEDKTIAGVYYIRKTKELSMVLSNQVGFTSELLQRVML